MSLEASISQWLTAHCPNVTSVSGSYSESTITGSVTAKYQIDVQSGVDEDLDTLLPLMLSGIEDYSDLDLDTTYILAVTQPLGDDVEYNFSTAATTSGVLDQLDKVA